MEFKPCFLTWNSAEWLRRKPLFDTLLLTCLIRWELGQQTLRPGVIPQWFVQFKPLMPRRVGSHQIEGVLGATSHDSDSKGPFNRLDRQRFAFHTLKADRLYFWLLHFCPITIPPLPMRMVGIPAPPITRKLRICRWCYEDAGSGHPKRIKIGEKMLANNIFVNQ